MNALQLRAKYGIPQGQIAMVNAVYMHPGTSNGYVAAVLSISKQYVGKHMKRLETAGVVINTAAPGNQRHAWEVNPDVLTDFARFLGPTRHGAEPFGRTGPQPARSLTGAADVVRRFAAGQAATTGR